MAASHLDAVPEVSSCFNKVRTTGGEGGHTVLSEMNATHDAAAVPPPAAVHEAHHTTIHYTVLIATVL